MLEETCPKTTSECPLIGFRVRGNDNVRTKGHGPLTEGSHRRIIDDEDCSGRLGPRADLAARRSNASATDGIASFVKAIDWVGPQPSFTKFECYAEQKMPWLSRVGNLTYNWKPAVHLIVRLLLARVRNFGTKQRDGLVEEACS